MKKLSMYQKVILDFLVIIIVIYLSFAYFWFSSQEEVENNRIQLTESQIGFSLITVREKLEQVRMEQKNLINNEYLNHLAITSSRLSYDTIKAYNNLQSALIDIKNKLDYVSAVEVYIPSQNKVFHANGISNMPYETYRSLIANDAGWFIYHLDGGQVTVRMYSVLFSECRNAKDLIPIYYMIFYVDSDKLNQLVCNILPRGSTYAIVSDESQKCIFTNSQDLYGYDDTSAFTQESHQDENRVRFTSKLDKLTIFADIPNELIRVYPIIGGMTGASYFFASARQTGAACLVTGKGF